MLNGQRQRNTDGIWSKFWYKKVEQSTTFNKFEKYIVVLKIFKKFMMSHLNITCYE